MKKLTAAALFIISTPLTAHAMRTDLQKHFAVSYALAMGGDVFCGDVIGIQEPYERAFCAFGSSFAVGFAKEVWDHTKPNNHFDSKDLMFDIAGAAMGAATSKILRDWKISVYKSTKTDEVGLMARYDF